MSRHPLCGLAGALASGVLIVGCGSNAVRETTPTSTATTTVGPSSVNLTFEAVPNLWGVEVPVPEGWILSGVQDLVSVTPVDGAGRGFNLTFIFSPAAVAARGECGGGVSPALTGPVTIAGHNGAYETYCPAGGATPGAWSVFLPATSGIGTWLWTYLGATGLESGPDAATFLAVLHAFTAAPAQTKPPPSGTPAATGDGPTS